MKGHEREDKLLAAAEAYRQTEQEFLDSIHNMIYHQELDVDEIARTDVYHPHQLVSNYWVDGVLASKRALKMKRLERNYGLIIGGAQQELHVGEKVIFNPELHMPLEDPYDPPFHTGDNVIVEMAQISVLNEGKEEVLLPPVVIHHHEERELPSEKDSKEHPTQQQNELRR